MPSILKEIPEKLVMPSGRTHDAITLWSFPFVTGSIYAVQQDGLLALLTGSGFLFGGLMFGPDLDIYSQQYKRWGLLRYLWLPYRKLVKRHRSWLSHWFIVGTLIRVLYLSGWVAGLWILSMWWGSLFFQAIGEIADWREMANGLLIEGAIATWDFLCHHFLDIGAVIGGIELGADSHSCSDWLVSAWNRHRKSATRAQVR